MARPIDPAEPKAFKGRDIFVDGPMPAFEIGVLVAQALGLPRQSVLREDCTPAQLDAALETDGRVGVFELAQNSELRVKLSMDLLHSAIDTGRLQALAQSHGLSVAWSLDEDREHDWHYHVARPDGTLAIKWFAFEDAVGSYAVRMKPQQDPSLISAMEKREREVVRVGEMDDETMALVMGAEYGRASG